MNIKRSLLALAAATSILLGGQVITASAADPHPIYSVNPFSSAEPERAVDLSAPVHWPSHDIVVENHASKQWDVEDASSAWSSTGYVRLTFGKCVSDKPCIKVVEKNLGKNNHLGETGVTALGAHLTGATVTLNTFYANQFDVTTKTNVSVHELGHAIGLPHNDHKASVMFWVAHTDGPTGPDPADISLLKTMYPHSCTDIYEGFDGCEKNS